MVVELRDIFTGNDMMTKIDELHYNIFGINRTYYGGEITSWQMYTRSLPLKGEIIIDAEENVAEFKLQEPLLFDRWYAILLLHANHEHINPIYEDFVIPFKTMKRPDLEEEQFPDDLNLFSCPITLNNFKEPVKISDGHTYEKSAIELWLKDNDTSPITREILTSTDTIPDLTMKELTNLYLNNKIIILEDKIQSICNSCNDVIVDDIGVKLVGKEYHQNCFKCTKCENTLTIDSFMMLESKLLCLNCLISEKGSKLVS